MIFVDSSVWIDYFRGSLTAETNRLDALLTDQQLATGDIVLTEVLQGFNHQADFDDAFRLLASLTIVEVGGLDAAIQAAKNYRLLRMRGITIRKTIDTLIATRCILNGWPLLYSDRDFDPFVEQLGLVSAMR